MSEELKTKRKRDEDQIEEMGKFSPTELDLYQLTYKGGLRRFIVSFYTAPRVV